MSHRWGRAFRNVRGRKGIATVPGGKRKTAIVGREHFRTKAAARAAVVRTLVRSLYEFDRRQNDDSHHHADDHENHRPLAWFAKQIGLVRIVGVDEGHHAFPGWKRG